MKLHSSVITESQIYAALATAQQNDDVASHVHFHILEPRGSRSRSGAFEIQLGTHHKVKGDNRGWKNSGNHGAADVYAATYDEWGFFIAELFKMDPEAIFGNYKGSDDFNQKTRYAY